MLQVAPHLEGRIHPHVLSLLSHHTTLGCGVDADICTKIAPPAIDDQSAEAAALRVFPVSTHKMLERFRQLDCHTVNPRAFEVPTRSLEYFERAGYFAPSSGRVHHLYTYKSRMQLLAEHALDAELRSKACAAEEIAGGRVIVDRHAGSDAATAAVQPHTDAADAAAAAPPLEDAPPPPRQLEAADSVAQQCWVAPNGTLIWGAPSMWIERTPLLLAAKLDLFRQAGLPVKTGCQPAAKIGICPSAHLPRPPLRLLADCPECPLHLFKMVAAGCADRARVGWSSARGGAAGRALRRGRWAGAARQAARRRGPHRRDRTVPVGGRGGGGGAAGAAGRAVRRP